MPENTNKSPKQSQRQPGDSDKPQKPDGSESTVSRPGSDKPDKIRHNNTSEDLDDLEEHIDLDELEDDDDDEDTVTR
jgi:hypothetical protein